MGSLTPERYLEIERAAEFKSEYFDGGTFAMSGGTYAHARLITSLAAEIKFHEYRKIDSLREYVLVSQTAPLIEVFVRGPEGDWRLREFAGLDAVCRLTSMDRNLAVADVYRNIPLEAGS